MKAIGRIISGLTMRMDGTRIAAYVSIILAAGGPCPSWGAEIKCPLPGNWKLDESVSDEFNSGALDKSKWYDYAPNWPGRPRGYRILASNVSQSEGMLRLAVNRVPETEIPYEQRMDGMKGFTCALVKSRKKVRYGYFEARIKCNPSIVRNAFWLYDPLSDRLDKKYSPGDVSEEIDIMECLGKHSARCADRPYFNSFATHHYLTPYYEGVCNNVNVPVVNGGELPFCPSADYHVYGLLWTEKDLVWYVDGVEFIRNPAFGFGQGGFSRPLHIVFDNEAVDWDGERIDSISQSDLPSIQKIDWFRRWEPREVRTTGMNATSVFMV